MKHIARIVNIIFYVVLTSFILFLIYLQYSIGFLSSYYTIFTSPKIESFEVVVARYNEDLDWLVELFPNNKVTIYNKGENDLSLPKHYKIIDLPNVGRESHSYLYHIIHNYSHLSDRTLFLQGNPFDHFPFYPLTVYQYKGLKKQLNNSFSNNIIVNPKLVNCEEIYVEKYSDVVCNKEYDLAGFARKFLNKEVSPLTIKYSSGANFAVDKGQILCHDVSFYKRLFATLDKHASPIEGFYLERLWDSVFDCSSF